MDIDVVGEATTGREAVEMTAAFKPDVVMMDIHLPELTGVEATRRIRHDHEDVRVLVLTAYNDPAYVYSLLEAGADGFVLKTVGLSELLNAVREVAVGRMAFDPLMMERAQGQPAAGVVEGLTDREIDVLTQAARDLTNKQIGTGLYISDRTVQGHCKTFIKSCT